MSEIATLFTQLGPNVALVVVLLYWIFGLQKKLMAIIESNTAATTAHVKVLEELVTAVSECHRENR